MFEYFKQALLKPLEALIIALCVGYVLMHMELFSVKEAVAVLDVQYKAQEVINERVIMMNETLIRIDENVKILKAK